VFQAKRFLIFWLHMRGIRFTKSVHHDEVVKKMESALKIEIAGFLPILELPDGSSSNYTSWEQLQVEEKVVWDSDLESVVQFFRSRAVKFDAPKISEVFGQKRNGVRLRAWRRFQGGNLDISKLKMTRVQLKATAQHARQVVTVVQCVCTPSMKSDVYMVYVVFDARGEFMPSPSQCGCPNGLLFCSHLLAWLIFVGLVQTKMTWSIADIDAFMPEPIKSIVALPLAAQWVFSDLPIAEKSAKIAFKKLGKDLAAELPGYSVRPSGNLDDEVSDEEGDELIQMELGLDDAGPSDVLHVHDGGAGRSVDVCRLLAIEIDHAKGRAAKAKKKKGTGARKYTSDAVNKHNADLVKEFSPAKKARRAKMFERLLVQFKAGNISENLMTTYLSHKSIQDATGMQPQ
jgi:hypothetical protein